MNKKAFSAFTKKKLHELISVIQQATEKLPDDDVCTSKHVGVVE
jgi:hypothetical protein